MESSSSFSSYISKWNSILIHEKSSLAMLINDSSFISKHKISFNTNYSQIIRTDVKRTRVLDRKNLTDFEEEMQKLLIFYCEFNTIEYKQGLNEIMGVLYLLRSNTKIELHEIYNVFSMFIDVFFTNYYYDKSLYALQSSIAIVDLLFKYHEPELLSLFNKSFVTSQMYTTNWLLTTYAK